MTPQQLLKPARELAKNNGVRFPNESDDYRRAYESERRPARMREAAHK